MFLEGQENKDYFYLMTITNLLVTVNQGGVQRAKVAATKEGRKQLVYFNFWLLSIRVGYRGQN